MKKILTSLFIAMIIAFSSVSFANERADTFDRTTTFEKQDNFYNNAFSAVADCSTIKTYDAAVDDTSPTLKVQIQNKANYTAVANTKQNLSVAVSNMLSRNQNIMNPLYNEKLPEFNHVLKPKEVFKQSKLQDEQRICLTS